MRRLVVGLALFAAAACASPEAPAGVPATDDAPALTAAADTAFDAADWMRRAAAVWDTAAWSADYDSIRAESKRYARELEAAVGWTDACDHDADALADSASEAGVMYRHDFGDGEALIEVTCMFYAYQGSFALVHVDGDRATLVRAPHAGDQGVVADTAAVLVGFMDVDPAAGTFSVFSKSRGFGDCGVYATYRIGDGPMAEVTEIRARDCDAEILDEMPPPATWPVVFPRG